jgi:hypothetical protein
MGIALQFMLLDCPTRSEWYGRGGTISYVRKIVQLPYSTNNIDIISSVFDEVSHCVVNGLDYDGMSRKQDANKGGRKPVVDINDQVLITMIADLIENGFGLRNTLCLVNGHLEESGHESISMSALCGAIQRLNAKTIPVKKRQQGSTDEKSPWAKARLQWAIHLLIRFSFLDLDNLEKPPDQILYEGHNLMEHPNEEFLSIIKAEVAKTSTLPDYFNKDKLTMLDVEQTLSFDEHHREAAIGTEGLNFNRQIVFPRDADGNAGPNGKHGEGKVKLNMKYNEEARFCFGCCWDGKKGRVCDPFVYIGQTIVTIADYEKAKSNEIARVKSLKGGSYWRVDRRFGRYWGDDPVDSVKYVGDTNKEKLR